MFSDADSKMHEKCKQFYMLSDFDSKLHVKLNIREKQHTNIQIKQKTYIIGQIPKDR